MQTPRTKNYHKLEGDNKSGDNRYNFKKTVQVPVNFLGTEYLDRVVPLTEQFLLQKI
ncbi:unnamed protein product [marine sediment metagenome]|uniref:Uncharacterized protein n=1 Tax=marine sediment metagenome TaxID=412755 RepID=X0WR85_9ZZZZ